MQTRYDDIGLGLFRKARREVLSIMRDDDVQEFSNGIYAQSKHLWTDWLRTTAGVRSGWYHADVHSDTPANSGTDSDFITSGEQAILIVAARKNRGMWLLFRSGCREVSVGL